MADLLDIALFFFLRSCEYTKTNSHRRTTQFLFQYMQFHDANGLIPPDAASNVFLAASEINLFLDTQKNCFRRESFTTDSTGLLHGDPVPACARRYLHLGNNNAPPDTTIYNYYVSMGAAPKSVTRKNVVELLWASDKQIGFKQIEFSHTTVVPISYVQEVPQPFIRPISPIALSKLLRYGGRTPS